MTVAYCQSGIIDLMNSFPTMTAAAPILPRQIGKAQLQQVRLRFGETAIAKHAPPPGATRHN